MLGAKINLMRIGVKNLVVDRGLMSAMPQLASSAELQRLTSAI